MKRLLSFIVAAVLCMHAMAATTLLNAVTTTGAGVGAPGNASPVASKSYQVAGTTTAGSGSAVVLIQGSNDGTNWDTIGTVTLTLGTASTSGSFASQDRYMQVRGNVTTLTGTGASVTATMGY
jgi:hypothetical protein